MGASIVKSPEGPCLQEQNLSVSRLLGMNIIRRCYSDQFVQLGPDLFDFPSLKSAGPRWEEALSECQAIESLNGKGYLGKAKVQG